MSPTTGTITKKSPETTKHPVTAPETIKGIVDLLNALDGYPYLFREMKKYIKYIYGSLDEDDIEDIASIGLQKYARWFVSPSSDDMRMKYLTKGPEERRALFWGSIHTFARNGCREFVRKRVQRNECRLSDDLIVSMDDAMGNRIGTEKEHLMMNLPSPSDDTGDVGATRTPQQPIVPPGDLPDPELDKARAILSHMVPGLSDEQRTLFAMRYYQDWSITEIAEAFGVPPGTVRTRLHRARQRVREILQTTMPEVKL